jgi:hypothetical protein
VTERSRLRASVLVLGGALVLAACARAGQGSPAATDAPSASPTAVTTPAATASSPAASPTAEPTAGIPDAGLPYDAAGILDAMATSQRPAGVPAQLQRTEVAAAVAAELWTFDGEPWVALWAGGSCGPTHCTLEVGGTSSGALGEDLYLFDVDASTGEVTVLSAELRGLPQAVADELDGFARANWPQAQPPGPMVSARWLPPPDAGVYILNYRSGGEEGSPSVDARVDLVAGTVTLTQPG